jgi:hypothetical protein
MEEKDAQDAILNLTNLCSLMVFSLLTASLSMFILKCQEPGMILRRYFLWLQLIWITSWRKKDRWKRFLLKPIGYCHFCYGSWLFIIIFLIIGKNVFPINSFILALFGILGIGLNYLFIEAIQKIKS